MIKHYSKIFIIIFIAILAAIVIIFFVINQNKQSVQTKKTEIPISTHPTIDTSPTKDKLIVNDNPAKDEPQTVTPIIQPVVVCATNSSESEFVLVSDALIYNTAADAKSKTNPAGTYHSGNYSIYKCYGSMANITKVGGSPGGWIDPNDPYAESSSVSTTNPVISNPIPADVMTLNNTIINWSHEYPSTFVSKYGGYWNIPGNNLYLTFDCGYDYNNLASKIMDILSTKNIKAVFFVTGDFMNARPDLIKRMLAEGHIVGNHSYSHLNQPQNLGTSTEVVVNDLQEWENKYISIVGTKPSIYYFRPPGGAISERSMGLMSELGYKTIMWGAAYNDWDTSAQPSGETAMELLRKYTTPGDIVLLHGISETSTNILSQYIDEYRAKGFEFKLLNL